MSYKGITIDKKGLDNFDFVLNHENQHAKDYSLQRMMEREPRFDTKYGANVFDKDTRKKIVELKQKLREAKNDKNNCRSVENIENELNDLINKNKKNTKEYKHDTNEKKKDKREEFEKKVKEYIDSPNNKKLKEKLNTHDIDDNEFYADLGAMKHGKDKEYTIKTQRELDKHAPNSKKHHNTNVARRETRNELKKRGLMNYVESFDD